MGMFDTFVGTIKCPKCGKDIEINCQTKSYDCMLKDIKIGDCIDKANANYFYKINSWGDPQCDNCKEEIPVYAAIRNGRLVSYIVGVEDIDDLDIMDIEDNSNIEKKNTKTKQDMAKIIYDELSGVYCDNCAFNSEISEEEAEKKFGYWGCEDCRRKYMGWRISKATAESMAKKIIKGEER